MEDILKNQISLKEFEQEGAKYNINGTNRSYFDSVKHLNEYENARFIDKEDYDTLVLEAVIDKSALEDFIKLLESHNFKSYKDKDIPYLLNIKKRIMSYPKTNKTISDLASIEKTIASLSAKQIQITKEDDAIIYFVPFNNKVKNIHDFFKVYREVFYEFALKNDLTIILRTKDKLGKTDGFFAFNFIDADETKKLMTYRYAIRIVLKSKIVDSLSYIEECLLLNTIGKNKVELDEVNFAIVKE